MAASALSISGGTTPLAEVAHEAVEDGGPGARSATGPLPCLDCNNSVQGSDDDDSDPVYELSPYHRRIAFVIAHELKHMVERFGLQNVGFLTLTFADHVIRMAEASRRFNNLNSNVISERYKRGMVIWERQKSGRLHGHLVIATGADIRTGIDFKAIEAGDYRSANPALRAEWAFWRKTAPAYRFGRTELLPVKSSAEGIAKYVGKYVGKQLLRRKTHDKGARLVRFLGYRPGDRTARTTFAWNSPGATIWRKQLAAFADQHGFRSMDDIRRKYGPRWAFILRVAIQCTGYGPIAELRKRRVFTYHPVEENAS